LGQREKHGGLAELLRRHLWTIADRIEGCRDDLPLLLRQLADLVAAAAAPAASHRLRRLVILPEGPNLHEVDVARGRLRALHGVVVCGLRVVRDEVAGREPEFFEVNRVARRHLGQRLRPTEQADRLLGTAVHRVEQLHLLDAVVVVSTHFREHFLDRARRSVAPRLLEADGRPLIGEHVDGVLR
jgi:hypothetical protein